jgi:hypothetical protein
MHRPPEQVTPVHLAATLHSVRVVPVVIRTRSGAMLHQRHMVLAAVVLVVTPQARLIHRVDVDLAALLVKTRLSLLMYPRMRRLTFTSLLPSVQKGPAAVDRIVVVTVRVGSWRWLTRCLGMTKSMETRFTRV